MSYCGAKGLYYKTDPPTLLLCPFFRMYKEVKVRYKMFNIWGKSERKPLKTFQCVSLSLSLLKKKCL